MTINFAHLRDRSTNGGYINFAVFEADANNRSNQGRALLLQQLTEAARQQNLRIDKTALAFSENGQIKFYGSTDLVNYLANSGVPRWTHQLDV